MKKYGSPEWIRSEIISVVVSALLALLTSFGLFKLIGLKLNNTLIVSLVIATCLSVLLKVRKLLKARKDLKNDLLSRRQTTGQGPSLGG
jgi:hypothetical protein